MRVRARHLGGALVIAGDEPNPAPPSPDHHLFRHRSALIVLVAAALICGGLGFFWRFGVIDDAFISLRYAAHLASGHGLRYGSGPPVEGFSSLLWVFLLAPAELFVGDGAGWARTASLLAAAWVLFLVGSWQREFATPALGRGWLAALLLAWSPPFVFYAASGMETTLFAALIVLALSGATRMMTTGDGLWRTLAALVLLVLTRPEAAAVCVYVVGSLCCLRCFRRRPVGMGAGRTLQGRQIVLLAAAVALAVSAMFLCRYLYFGSWLPNTYYAKIGTPNAQLFAAGIGYATRFAVSAILPAVVLVVFARRRLRKSPRHVFLALFLVYWGVLVGVEGGDHLPLFRFFVPVLPVLYLLAFEVIATTVADAAPRLGYGPAQGRIAAAAIFVLLGAASSLLLARDRGLQGISGLQLARVEARLAQTWEMFGRWLALHAQPGDAVAALPIGAIGYYSGLPIVDLAGLTDPVVARLPMATGMGIVGHEKYDVGEVLRRRPRVVLAHHFVFFRQPVTEAEYRAMAYFPVHRALLRDQRFARQYVFRLVATNDGHFAFYERRRRWRQ